VFSDHYSQGDTSRGVVFTTVLCDLDGTLIDSRWDIAEAFQHALRQVTSDIPQAASITQHIGKPLEQMLHALGYTFSPDSLSAFLTAYRSHYAAHGVTHTIAFPGVMTTLQTLSTTTFGVVTTKEQGQAEGVLQRLHLAHFFRHIQGWRPGLRLKPAPDTVLVALEALHCVPAQTLMVGDTPADVLAGKAAGLKTCAVTYGYSTVEALQQCEPNYFIASFDELLTLVPGSPC
jgi:HAD superfamily hydrolase (TIGR01509 family)